MKLRVGHLAVAPSRARGSKRRLGYRSHCRKRSRLHGRADRNSHFTLRSFKDRRSRLHGRADRNSMSTGEGAAMVVAPSRARGSKRFAPNMASRSNGRAFTGARIETITSSGATSASGVAPSRARGSKHVFSISESKISSRAFTGARIETIGCESSRPSMRSRLHGRADRNPIEGIVRLFDRSRLHGRADRNLTDIRIIIDTDVAPSRARGSKQLEGQLPTNSHCRAFTGARIETDSY